MNADKVILGWREWLGFPDLGISSIKAKVDTGARTSCLHAFYVEPFEREGADWIRFGIHPNQRDNETEVHCEAAVRDRRVVRDSGGHEETRYVIETTITVGDQRLSAEVTLTDRDSMKFRALLGRTAIRRNYLVDPGRSFVQGRRKKRKPGRTG
ncbi:ATP-dependent zinc protease [Seongchinamella unica]|uniref:ATP-dependent zinc protease n=1 Tax=Seongchinamella unica TaxID=2547392 RepID=A0A4R5LWD9_9GAMM|nr:ATP-dependent zinc protease [Seongchinamella unica]TDG15773.1 ATP-dependent zinc protease [Seongchinamella unica]